MPRGDKTKYTDKQKRKAEHIAESYEEKGLSAKDAESRAWATVNKDDGGGKKSGSGRSVGAASVRAQSDQLRQKSPPQPGQTKCREC